MNELPRPPEWINECRWENGTSFEFYIWFRQIEKYIIRVSVCMVFDCYFSSPNSRIALVIKLETWGYGGLTRKLKKNLTTTMTVFNRTSERMRLS